MVRVENDGAASGRTGQHVRRRRRHSVRGDLHAVGGGDGADVVSGSDGTSDGSLLLVVGDTLSGEVGSSSLGDLKDDGSLVVTGGFKGGNNGRGGGDVLTSGEGGDEVSQCSSHCLSWQSGR